MGGERRRQEHLEGLGISGFPADAQVVANAAGLEAAYADLKTNP